MTPFGTIPPARLVLVACGGAKGSAPAPARELYVGRYFRACLGYALTIAPPAQVCVLSAKHGLLPLDEVIAPYDVRLGQPHAIGAGTVRRQARERGLLDHRVIVLGGEGYRRLAAAVWPDCEGPLRGAGGIGAQLAWLAQLTAARTEAPALVVAER